MNSRKGPELQGETQQKSTSRGRLDREAQARIGEQLRKMHDEVVRQGVPDRFVELLSRLDSKTSPEKSDDSDK